MHHLLEIWFSWVLSGGCVGIIELMAMGISDAVLLGSTHAPATLRIKEFLTRNMHPYSYIDLDHDSGAQVLLDRFHVSVDDVPVLICRGEVVLRNPSDTEIAECLGFNEPIDQQQLRDVVVIGAGPAGRVQQPASGRG